MRLTWVASALIWTSLVQAGPIERRDIPDVSQVTGDSSSGMDTQIPDASDYAPGASTRSKATSSGGKKTSGSASGSGSKTTDKPSSDSASGSGGDSKTDSKKNSTTTSSTSISINPEDPAGGISFVTPASTDTTYIKIGDQATFEWKYTSLKVTPSHLNVMAVCSANSETITVTTGHPATETRIIWDTNSALQNSSLQLLTSKYVLQIFDSKGNMSTVAHPQPGYLQPVEYDFGMYRRQTYTPWPSDSTYLNVASYLDVTSLKWVASLVLIAGGTALHIIVS